MNKLIKSLLIVALFITCTPTLMAQAPSTEGRDFWVTFLRADEAKGGPEKLTLTISAQEKCDVTITNTNTRLDKKLTVNPGNTTIPMIDEKASCYSNTSEQAVYTALHVTATKDISLFAGNYRDKSFDAANILPSTALLDDYLIQTYPPSVHEDKPQGSHFAIVATEDNTIVDYNLTAQTVGGKTGTQTTPPLKAGQVWYVWTGEKDGDAADLSGTTVKARDEKHIAVFQGCSHTCIPDKVRDRDHIFSQAMPTAYWGTEFGITASRHHRRDIIAVMAINDGTEVFINNKNGEKKLVHTFDFNKDKKRYWTFEIGEEEAYCTDSDQKHPLDPPLVADSSCYLTTSCPSGVHLFMVSNTYDEETPSRSDNSISDPAMLWISPIEQVIKNISFSTYADGTNVHYLNVLTTTAGISNIILTDAIGEERSLAQDFYPLRGNPDYSYARIEIENGQYNLKGKLGFLAHVYGFGERCSYAYSCGSSTVQRAISMDGVPIEVDSICLTPFCYYADIEMKLNIGNNDYESIVWDYGDGITYTPPSDATNEEKRTTRHIYTTDGWYDMRVTAVYVNSCTGQKLTETMTFSFAVTRPDTVKQMAGDMIHIKPDSTLNRVKLNGDSIKSLLDHGTDTIIQGPNCYDTIYIYKQNYCIDTYATDSNGIPYNDTTYRDTLRFDLKGQDSIRIDTLEIHGWFSSDKDTTIITENQYRCDSIHPYHIKLIACVYIEPEQDEVKVHACKGDSLILEYTRRKGDVSEVELVFIKLVGIDSAGNYLYGDTLDTIPVTKEDWENWIKDDDDGFKGSVSLPTNTFDPGKYKLIITLKEGNQLECGYKPPFTKEVIVTISYPKTIIVQKSLNNILAVLSATYNGGYEFSGFQWYKNGEPIPGATQAIYHSDEPFDPEDEYTVLLTDSNGIQIHSCEIDIMEAPQQGDPNQGNQNQNPTEEQNETTEEQESNPAEAPAQKLMLKSQMVIRKDGRTFNIYGQRVQ